MTNNPTATRGRRGAGRGGGGGRHNHSDGAGTGIAAAALHHEQRPESSSSYSGFDTASERTDSVYSTSPRQEAYFDRWNRKQLRDSDCYNSSSHGGGGGIGITGRKSKGGRTGRCRRSKLLSGASEAARVLFSRRGGRRPDRSADDAKAARESESDGSASADAAASRRAAERFIEEENAAAAAIAEHELAVGRWESGGTCVRVVAHEEVDDDGTDLSDVVGRFGSDRRFEGDDDGGDDVTMAARKESLRLQRRFLGGNDADVALTLNNIGNVYYGRGEVAEAMEAYEEALRVSSSSSTAAAAAGVPRRNY